MKPGTAFVGCLGLALALTACDGPTHSSTSPSADPTGTAAPNGAAAAPSSSAAAGKAYACGAKEQPPCPLQGWMKTVLARAVSAGETAKVAEALSTLAGKAPPDMPKWKAISEEGAAKAKAGDLEAAKDSCSACHDAYKDLYRRTMRDRPW